LVFSGFQDLSLDAAVKAEDKNIIKQGDYTVHMDVAAAQSLALLQTNLKISMGLLNEIVLGCLDLGANPLQGSTIPAGKAVDQSIGFFNALSYVHNSNSNIEGFV
jgi:hypothetical protein